MKTLFFGLHLICSPEKNRGRGSSPPKLKIRQTWGKIASYPPNAQQRWAPLLIQRPKPFLVWPTKTKIFLLVSKKHVQLIKPKFLVAKIADSRMLRILKQ